MTNGVSFIVATIGRPSLLETLASIQLWPEDELIVVGSMGAIGDDRARFIPCPPAGDWGSTERNVATPHARGRYLAHIDDDDVYAPGARTAMAKAMTETPNKLTIFKMQYPDGSTLWNDPIMRWGNVGTPMIFMPNDRLKLGQWGERMDCGDLHFLQTMKWAGDDIVWSTDVIAHVSQAHP